MKSIDVELVKSNMLPMFASQRFYASWKAFIRELVLNAIDACNVRQALELSWGTEFLEMEQANQMREVRQIYEPRIDITYDSTNRILTVEDNGIGINEYDLKHYVAKIGKAITRAGILRTKSCNMSHFHITESVLAPALRCRRQYL